MSHSNSFQFGNDMKSTDLDEIFEEVNDFQKTVGELQRTNSELQHLLEVQNQKLRNGALNEDKYQKEIASLQELLASSQKATTSKCDMQDANSKLEEEVDCLKLKMQKLEQEYKVQASGLEKEISDGEIRHGLELQNVKEALEMNSRRAVDELNLLINERSCRLEEAQQQIKELEQEKQAELMRVRLEFDGKLLKLQTQLASVTASHSNSLSLASQDIYRKKLQHVQAESDRKIACLERKIQDLERTVSTSAPQQHMFKQNRKC